MTYCKRVHVDGVIVRNNIDGYGPSSDGINTDSSSDILVENCDVDCNDDNYCLKAGMNWDGQRVNRPTENIVYRNSIARSGHGLITLADHPYYCSQLHGRVDRIRGISWAQLKVQVHMSSS